MNQSQIYKAIVLGLCAIIAVAGAIVTLVAPGNEVGSQLGGWGVALFVMAFVFIDIVPDPKKTP